MTFQNIPKAVSSHIWALILISLMLPIHEQGWPLTKASLKPWAPDLVTSAYSRISLQKFFSLSRVFPYFFSSTRQFPLTSRHTVIFHIKKKNNLFRLHLQSLNLLILLVHTFKTKPPGRIVYIHCFQLFFSYCSWSFSTLTFTPSAHLQ